MKKSNLKIGFSTLALASFLVSSPSSALADCEKGGAADPDCPYWNVLYEPGNPDIVGCLTGGEFKCAVKEKDKE